MKRSTKKMATFFGVLIILACMFLIPLSLQHGNISLDAFKGVSFLQLEPTSLSQLGLPEATFSKTKSLLFEEKEFLSIVKNIFFTVLFALVTGFAFWEYCKAGLRMEYSLELKALRAARKKRTSK